MENKLVASLRTLLAIVCPLAVTAVAHGFNHPGAAVTLEDLARLKANLNTEPWKSGYAALAGRLSGRGPMGMVATGC